MQPQGQQQQRRAVCQPPEGWWFWDECVSGETFWAIDDQRNCKGEETDGKVSITIVKENKLMEK